MKIKPVGLQQPAQHLGSAAIESAKAGDIIVIDNGGRLALSPRPRLFALAEAYPQLKANENFLALQKQIAERLEARRDRWGYSYHGSPGDKAHDFAPIVAALTGT